MYPIEVNIGALPLCATGIGGYDNGVFVIEFFADVIQHGWLSIQIIDRHIKKPLYLRCMEVHCLPISHLTNGGEVYDDMVAPGGLEHIGDELSCDGSPRLVLFILASIRETGDDSRDSAGRGSATGIYHDKEFHEMVVDGIRSGLDDKNIFIPDGFPCPVSGRAPEKIGPIVIAVSQLEVLRTTTLAQSRPSLRGLFRRCGGGGHLSATLRASSGWLLPAQRSAVSAARKAHTSKYLY